MSKKAVYLTTTLPYVNADPHIGFALEIIKADIYARYRALLGDEVFFNTGTDEHGQKIWQKALEQGKDPQTYVDEYAAKFRALKDVLGLSSDIHFIRTTDAHHIEAAQEFWKRCAASGDIYKKLYQIKYCVGCELEKTDSELVDGKCPLHPNLEIELIDEENYFFRFSKYQQELLDLYAKHPDFVLPDFRLNEIKLFVERGLQDFSISRLKEKMPWGIPVPDDPDHVMYVWFDALVNYISTLGWPEDEATFEKFWGTHEHPNARQIAGKDNLRQQSAMWQAMLMSARLPNSKQIVIQGFITSGGQKMSKSLGNVIDPLSIVEEYGVDALRYFLARHVSPFDDSDFTMEKFKEAYNADLANGLGNTVARIMTLSENHLDRPVEVGPTEFQKEFEKNINIYEFNAALALVSSYIVALDELITKKEPFKLIKSNSEDAKLIIADGVRMLWGLNYHLQMFIPRTSELIREAILNNKKPENLFPRKE